MEPQDLMDVLSSRSAKDLIVRYVAVHNEWMLADDDDELAELSSKLDVAGQALIEQVLTENGYTPVLYQGRILWMLRP